MKKLLLMVCIASVCLAHAQTKTPGNAYFNTNGYVEYIFGNMPVIISAPHGGWLKPTDIPDRTDANCGTTVTTATDSYTQEMARALDTSLRNLLGCRPHTIICKISRVKVDMNREVNEAACNNPIAVTTWYNYQGFIDTARQYIKAKYGRGLFIDIHGHGHTIQRNELGYTLTANTLRQSDAVLNQTSTINNSSIRYLTNNNLTTQTHAQLIRGTKAFGTLLTNAGYPTVPSQQDAYPQISEAYFDGGYNTQRWGSSDSSTFDAIQIETNYTGVRNNTNNIKKFADSLAVVIKRYIETNFMNSLQLAQCKAIVAGGGQAATGIKHDLFDIFPNPVVNGNAIINLANTQPWINIKILQTDGRICFQQTYYQTSQINMQIPPVLQGLCIMQVTTQNKSQSQKIMMDK